MEKRVEDVEEDLKREKEILSEVFEVEKQTLSFTRRPGSAVVTNVKGFLPRFGFGDKDLFLVAWDGVGHEGPEH